MLFAISFTALLAASITDELELLPEHEVHTAGRLVILYQPFCVEPQFELASLPVREQKLFSTVPLLFGNCLASRPLWISSNTLKNILPPGLTEAFRVSGLSKPTQTAAT